MMKKFSAVLLSTILVFATMSVAAPASALMGDMSSDKFDKKSSVAVQRASDRLMVKGFSHVASISARSSSAVLSKVKSASIRKEVNAIYAADRKGLSDSRKKFNSESKALLKSLAANGIRSGKTVQPKIDDKKCAAVIKKVEKDLGTQMQKLFNSAIKEIAAVRKNNTDYLKVMDLTNAIQDKYSSEAMVIVESAKPKMLNDCGIVRS
jgi:hypothetical protein